MSEVIDLLGDIAITRVPVRVGPSQRGDVVRTGADTTAARLRLGWAPRVGLAEGLRSELEWVRHRADVGPATLAVVGKAS